MFELLRVRLSDQSEKGLKGVLQNPFALSGDYNDYNE